MIDKKYGQYAIVCDVGNCGESLEGFDTFQDAVEGKKEHGWKSRKVDGQWQDVCPEH